MDAAFTFDTTAGTPYEVNQPLNVGASYTCTYTVTTTGGAAYDFTDYTASSQMAKSVGVGASGFAVKTFNVGFGTSSTEGKMIVSLAATDTRDLASGRYWHDCLITAGAGSTVYRILEGSLLVTAGISSAPNV